MGEQVVVQCWGGEDADALLDVILPIYEEVYAEPPYCEGPRDVADFIARFQRQAPRRGFCTAVASDGGELVAFSFGFLLPADTGWWEGLLEPLPSEATHETGDRTFVIIELAVRKPWRRRGLAATLHAALLDGLVAERVTLTMRPEPEAMPAQRAYAAWGYRKVGQSQPWEEAPVYDVMILDLKPEGDVPGRV